MFDDDFYDEDSLIDECNDSNLLDYLKIFLSGKPVAYWNNIIHHINNNTLSDYLERKGKSYILEGYKGGLYVNTGSL